MKIAFLIALAACTATPQSKATAPTFCPACPAADPSERAPVKASEQSVRSLSVESRIPLVEREFGLMAGYVDDPVERGAVKFVVIARNGKSVVNSIFRLDNAAERGANEAAASRFLAAGNWVPMRVGTPMTPSDPGTVKQWRLDERVTANADDWGNVSFEQDGSAFALPAWVFSGGVMPPLYGCRLGSLGDPPRVLVEGLAYDSETRLVWVVFGAQNALARQCGLHRNVHGFEMWSNSEYPAEFLLNPSK